MITETALRRAHGQATTERAPIRPRRKLRGSWRHLHRLQTAGSRRPAPEHLMLLGPSGGPVWSARRP